MNFDYSKICQNLLKDLPGRQKEVILRRFALSADLRRPKPTTVGEGRSSSEGGAKRETLESIGKDFGITRERVRQIENDGFLRLKPKLEPCQKIFQHFTEQLKNAGELRKEEILLSELGKENYQPHVFFLLTLGEPFKRFSETKEFYSLWTINPNSLTLCQKVVDFLYKKLTKINRPLSLSECKTSFNVSPPALKSFLEISKIIQENEDGFFGLKDWPEINPRSVKDKSYLVFKKAEKPLHFREVAQLIGPDALPQTVHNELIRDPRFVLVGRGLYALKEWGYEAGQVKDVISKVLREAGKPLPREEILENVLKQRLVKENTILLNLGDKKYFLKTPEGKYTIQKS